MTYSPLDRRAQLGGGGSALPKRLPENASQAKVNATVEIRQGQTYSLPSVLIYTNVPPTMMKFERHVVAPQRPTLPNVDVTGPPAQIERLKPGGDFTPKVRVTIDPKDLEQTEFIKRVTAADFELPPDVKVLNPNRDIPYTVSPR